MYWIIGLLMIGSIFFGIVLVVGNICIFKFVIGIIVFKFIIVFFICKMVVEL